MKDSISRNEEWNESVDLFFYRTQDEVIKMQEKERERNTKENLNADDDNLDDMIGGPAMDDYPDNDDEQKVQQKQQQPIAPDYDDAGDWQAEPPQEYDDNDDGWGNNDEAGAMDFDTW